MPDATDTRDTGQRARDLAATLLEQADEYDRFATTVGGDLGPHYKDLARALRCRAAVLIGPYGAPDVCVPQGAARLTPRGPREAGRAWQAFLALVTARREGIDGDGAQLLGDLDPGAVLWVAVFAMTGVLSTVSEQHVQTLMSRWGVSAAQMAEGVSSDGR